MNVYEAIMKAADWIERNPRQYSFLGATKSPRRNDNGCLIGWIAFFAGEPAGQRCGSCDSDDELPRRLLGVSFNRFFRRLADISFGRYPKPFTEDAASAACVLRLYAATYHGHEKPSRNFARELYDKVSVAPRIPEEA